MTLQESIDRLMAADPVATEALLAHMSEAAREQPEDMRVLAEFGAACDWASRVGRVEGVLICARGYAERALAHVGAVAAWE